VSRRTGSRRDLDALEEDLHPADDPLATSSKVVYGASLSEAFITLLTMRLELSSFELRTWNEPGEAYRFTNLNSIVEILRRIFYSGFGVSLRRALARAPEFGDLSACDDHELIVRISEEILAGRLKLIENRRAAAMHFGGSDRPGPMEEEQDSADSEPTPDTSHWIEVVLVDEVGEPILGAQCIITTPDSIKHKSKTDSQGRVRVNGIPEGMCSVEFPALEEVRRKSS